MSFEDRLAHKLYRKYYKDEAVAFLTHYSSIK